MRVLLIHGDLDIARTLSLKLTVPGSGIRHVAAAGSGQDGLNVARHGDHDIILLHLALPDMDGCEVLRRMRAAWIDKPIMALSDGSKERAKARAFRAGADGFMTKPFDTADLIARVHLLVRRSGGTNQAVLQIGALALDLDRQQAKVEGRTLRLAAKEWAILELLLLSRGHPVSRETLLNQLYRGIDEPGLKTIDVFVGRLRRKLIKAGAGNLIGMARGHGYRLQDSDSAAPSARFTVSIPPAVPAWFTGIDEWKLHMSFQAPAGSSITSPPTGYTVRVLNYGLG